MKNKSISKLAKVALRLQNVFEQVQGIFKEHINERNLTSQQLTDEFKDINDIFGFLFYGKSSDGSSGGFDEDDTANDHDYYYDLKDSYRRTNKDEGKTKESTFGEQKQQKENLDEEESVDSEVEGSVKTVETENSDMNENEIENPKRKVFAAQLPLLVLDFVAKNSRDSSGTNEKLRNEDTKPTISVKEPSGGKSQSKKSSINSTNASENTVKKSAIEKLNAKEKALRDVTITSTIKTVLSKPGTEARLEDEKESLNVDTENSIEKSLASNAEIPKADNLKPIIKSESSRKFDKQENIELNLPQNGKITSAMTG